MRRKVTRGAINQACKTAAFYFIVMTRNRNWVENEEMIVEHVYLRGRRANLIVNLVNLSFTSSGPWFQGHSGVRK